MPSICAAIAVGCLTVQADEPSKTKVKKLAMEVSEATVTGDYAKLIDRTYPGVVKELGGRKEALEFTEMAMKQMKAQGFVLKEIKIGEPGEFLTEGREHLRCRRV